MSSNTAEIIQTALPASKGEMNKMTGEFDETTCAREIAWLLGEVEVALKYEGNLGGDLVPQVAYAKERFGSGAWAIARLEPTKWTIRRMSDWSLRAGALGPGMPSVSIW